jgi:hypothetical protein
MAKRETIAKPCTNRHRCGECRTAAKSRFLDIQDFIDSAGRSVNTKTVRDWSHNPPSTKEIEARCAQIQRDWDEEHFLKASVCQPEMYRVAGMFDQVVIDLKAAVTTACHETMHADEIRADGIAAWQFLMGEGASKLAELVSCEPWTVKKNVLLKAFRDPKRPELDGLRQLRAWLINSNADRVAEGSISWMRTTFGV